MGCCELWKALGKQEIRIVKWHVPASTLCRTNTGDGAAGRADFASDIAGAKANQREEGEALGGVRLVRIIAALDVAGVALTSITVGGGGSSDEDSHGGSDKEGDFGEHS